MNTRKKSNSVVTTKVEGKLLEITVLGSGTILFDAYQASRENRDRAEMHGWTQRLCDVAARSRDPKTGLPVSPQVKYEAILELADWYMLGGTEWKRVGTGERGAGVAGNLLLAALQEAYPDRPLEKLKAFLKGKSAGDKLALSQSKQLKPIIERLTAEMVGETDLDADLDAFMDDDADEEETDEKGAGDSEEPNF
ncbi:unnamed protein product [Sphagnum balticum]